MLFQLDVHIASVYISAIHIFTRSYICSVAVPALLAWPELIGQTKIN